MAHALRFRTQLTILFVASVAACGGEDPPVATSVSVSPANASVALGEAVQLVAQVLDQDGVAFPGTVSWSSRDLDVATVGATGSVTGLEPGTAEIVATFGSISGEALVTVTDDVPPTVAFVSPEEDETLFGVTLVVADAADNDEVESVELWVDGVLAITLDDPPWEFSWNTTEVSNGEHLLRVVAIDASGNDETSFSRRVVVANSPVSFGDWEALPPLPIPVRSAAVATDGANVYVMGGSAQGGKTDAVQILDLASETWSVGTPLPDPVDWGTAVWADGLLHFMGGITASSGTSAQHLVYENDDWVPSTDMPMPIAGTASVAKGAEFYVFAGNSGSSPAHTAGTVVFEVGSTLWAPRQDVPAPRINWSGTLAGDYIYLIGGGTPGLSTSSDLLRYDPTGDSWSFGRPIAQAREAHGTAMLLGLVCAVGGRLASAGNFGTPFDDVSCYDPQADVWYPAPPLPRALQEVNAVSLGDAVIAIGGANSVTNPVGDVSRLSGTISATPSPRLRRRMP